MVQQVDGIIAKARQGVARGAWPEAHALLDAYDKENGLDHDGLALLADAAYMTSHVDQAIATWERAHAAALHSGDTRAAANAALWITMLLLDTSRLAPLRGWLRHLESLLESMPEDPVHAGAKINSRSAR